MPRLAAESSAPASRAAQASPAGPPAPERGPVPVCQNCGAPLHGAYCHRCGQHDFDFHRSFWHVLLEALESVFHFDEKFFRNLASLLFRPGRLTADFNAGRRASQVPPFRLYIFVSFLYFLFAFLHPDRKAELHEQVRALPEKIATAHQAVTGQAPTLAGPAAKEQRNATAETLRQPGPSADPAPATSTAPAVPAEADPPAAAADDPASLTLDLGPLNGTWLGQLITVKLRQALAQQHETLEAILHAVPKLLLLCLPLFALYTRLLFRGGGSYFLQHLVGSVHVHTFYFLWRLLSRGLVFLTGLASLRAAGWVDTAAELWLLLYPVLMLRRLYQETWGRTLWKSAALSCLYGLTLLLAFFATSLVVILLR